MNSVLAAPLKAFDRFGERRPLLRRASLPVLFVLLNALPLAACLREGISRGYLVNLDFAPVLLLAAIRLASPVLRAVQLATIFLGLLTISAIDLFISLSEPFNHGVFGGSEYAAGIVYWPWGMFLPWLAVLLALCAFSLGALRSVRGRPYARELLVIVLVLFGTDVWAGNTHFYWRPGALLPNLVSSSSLRFLQGEELTNGLKSVTPLSEPSMASRIGQMPSPPPHILSVAVESLGAPLGGRVEPFQHRLLADLGDSYSLSYATTQPYYGKTLQGEVRELCGARIEGMPHRPAEFARLGRCLPAALAMQGYRTSAYHGNSGDFYHRAGVYPAIGISNLHFRDDLLRRGQVCDRYMFKGVCDRDVFSSAMAEFSNPGRQFVHLMTLDTHFPQPDDPTAGCRQPEGKARELCLYNWYFDRAGAQLAAAVNAAKTKPDLIVVYGDHAPPFSDRDRDLFSHDLVPYLEFRRKP